MTTVLRRLAALGALCLGLGAAGCGLGVGTGGTSRSGVGQPAPPRSLGPMGVDTIHHARTPTGLHRKAVVGKEAPSTLVARDGSRCVVDPGRYERREVGDRVWCVWRAPGTAP